MSSELFELAFEFAPDAQLLIDPDGRIVGANARAERLLGCSRLDLVGQRLEALPRVGEPD
jgi:PAS domain S-box-containing protein